MKGRLEKVFWISLIGMPVSVVLAGACALWKEIVFFLYSAWLFVGIGIVSIFLFFISGLAIKERKEGRKC